ncbi:MAG: hypothetical protein K9L66_03015 [Spirochaetaceae bacterium]|nr:hypothetical protein [Spirochaetaceae bacterium]MCF7950623.1 hypothetical protein [Spirochaetaceae bacterium]
MDKRKSEIHEHQSAIDELDVTIERQTAELGRLILQNDECPQEALKESFGVGKEIQSEIAAKENRREDIRSALERLRQLDEQLEELDEEDKTFDKSRSEMVTTLGAHAYRVYRTGSLKKEEFDKIFEEISELDTQLSEKEREVQNLSIAQGEKNLFKKLPGGAKISLLKSGIVRLEKKRDAALTRVGERLLETEKIEEIPDEQVRSATSNIKQQEERREERGHQRVALTQEKEELNQKIEAQSSSASPEKALKQLDNEIKQQQERLYTQQLQVGKVYLLQSSSEGPEDFEGSEGEEQQMVLNRIRELEQQKQQHQDKVNTLQSELEIEELQDDMKKKEEHIARLEKKISEEKQEVEQIRDDLSADNNRVKELRRMVQSKEVSAPAGAEQPKKAAPKKQKSAAPSTSAKKTKKEQELDLETNASEQETAAQEDEVQNTQGETPDGKK